MALEPRLSDVLYELHSFILAFLQLPQFLLVILALFQLASFEELVDLLNDFDGMEVRRVDDACPLIVHRDLLFYLLSGFFAQIAHLVELEDLDLSVVMAFVLKSIYHFLEVRLVGLQEDFLVHVAECVEVRITALNTVNLTQLGLRIGLFSLLDALRSLFVLFPMRI